MQAQLLDLFTTPPSFNNFIALNNEHIVSILQEETHQFIHIIGATSSGKTHLLKAATNQATKSAIFIRSVDLYPPTSQNNIPYRLSELANHYHYIAIDDIDLLHNEEQIALFDLFNKIKLNNLDNILLTSSSINLSELSNLRDDLKTRILSGVNLHLKALADADLHTALHIFTANEGISLGEIEQNYLINHYTRNIGVLIQTIKHVAEAALLKGRNITIPLIREILTTTATKSAPTSFIK
ncbi:MAG: hypothetical protein KBD37_03865 [Burkholderiales bacterium]|nr:hypothetical protein [Burkholderiales bacterium]